MLGDDVTWKHSLYHLSIIHGANQCWTSTSYVDVIKLASHVLQLLSIRLRASPPCRRKACSRKALWSAPSLQPKILTRHSPTVSCFLALHIEKVSWIFHVSLNTSGWGQKEPGMWAQQGAMLTRKDSEWRGKFEELWQSRPRLWRRVGHVFLQGRVKGLA